MYDKPITVRKCKNIRYPYFVDSSHPLAQKESGRVYMHRHIVSIREGRWISSSEHVHHIDGDPDNFEDSNLLLTNASDHVLEHHPPQFRTCSHCGSQFRALRSSDLFCSQPCSHMGARRFDIDAENLRSLVWSMPTLQVAKIFGVSDVAVAKRCRLLGVDKPPRGYWRKVEVGLIV